MLSMEDDVFVKLLDTVDSTNCYARDEADELWREAGCGARMAVVAARMQTAGRGQRGNVWLSQGGRNLLLSILLRPGDRLLVKEQFCLSQTVAVALHRTMSCYGIETLLKWPNDIYVGNRKLAGVLVELDFSGQYIEQAIIGIGLNVNQEQFPHMERIPVSMKMLIGKELATDDVLTVLIDEFKELYDELLFGNRDVFVSRYERLLLGYGERRLYKDSNGEFYAVIEGVDPSGQLLLRHDDGALLRYRFKEVEQFV